MMEPLDPGASKGPVAAAHISWSVSPPGSVASRMRELLSEVYGTLLVPSEVSSVAMVGHELLENLIKYSIEGVRTFDVEIRCPKVEATVRLQTRNQGLPAQLARVKALVERLARAPDPVAVYDELIATSPQREGSGIGLARICAEGGMSLACSVDGATLTLVAERPVSIRSSRP